MDFFNCKPETRRVCVCVCVSGESEEFTGIRIGYSRQKKNPHCLNASLPALYKRTNPKSIMQCKLWQKLCYRSLAVWFVNIFFVCVLFRYPCTIKSPYCQWNERCQMHIQDYALSPHWIDKSRNNKTLHTLIGARNKSARKGTYWRTQRHVQW